MSVTYVDTSVLASIFFEEPGSGRLVGRLGDCQRLVSSNLLEAEIRAACARERVGFERGAVSGIDWILPDRALTSELEVVARAGRLRGADLWHVATALYVSPQPDRLVFATLDNQQEKVAAALGFPVL